MILAVEKQATRRSHRRMPRGSGDHNHASSGTPGLLGSSRRKCMSV